jgi:hypothetical protein
MKLSIAGRLLANALAVYVACDILLTPLGSLETRPIAKVTGVGYVALGLLFVGLVLAILAIVAVLRRSPRAPAIAIVAAILFVPAFLAEQTGHFSAILPPTRIETVEVVQLVVAAVVVVLALWVRQGGKASAAKL